jgi:hypothetical protein
MNESDLQFLPEEVRAEIEGPIRARSEVIDDLGRMIGKGSP